MQSPCCSRLFTFLLLISICHSVIQAQTATEAIKQGPLTAESILQGVASGTGLDLQAVYDSQQSGLQTLFLHLLRALHSNAALPYQVTGDLWGSGRGQLDRISISAFLAKSASAVQPNSRCIEWGINYIAQEPFAQMCTEKWTFEYSTEPRIDQQAKTVYANMDHLSRKMREELRGFFNVVMSTQVFEHVQQPFDSIRNIQHILAEDGLLFFTVPFLSRYHIGHGSENKSAPLDHYRYTLAGVRYLMQSAAGLKIQQEWLAGGSLMTLAHLTGYGANDFSATELEEVLYDPKDHVIGHQTDLYYNAFVLAQKSGRAQ